MGSLALSLSGSVRAPLGTCLVAVESLEPFIISLLFSSLPISNYLVFPPQPSPTGDSGESDKDMRARARTHKELKRERKKKLNPGSPGFFAPSSGNACSLDVGSGSSLCGN